MERTKQMREFYIEFIKLYRSKPELWKVKSEEYKNKVLKANAYQALADKFKDIGEDVDKLFVKKKINSLRSSYRRELRKYKASTRMGIPYVPTLWHFKYLHFLKDQEESLVECDEEDDDHQHSLDQHVNLRHSDGNNKGFDNIPRLPSFKSERRRANSFSTSNFSEDGDEDMQEYNTNSMCKGVSLNQNELLELAFQQLKQSNDEPSILARVWSNEFRKLAPDQQIFAKKAIDDILFEARLGTLHRHSVKINETSNSYNMPESKVLEFEYEEAE